MLEVYQFGADGYFAGPVAMPNNTTPVEPKIVEGYWPMWNGEAWVQVENHKGKTGYLDGQPHTISEYGPLPEGWSDTPPEPTAEEKAAAIRAERNALLAATDHYTVADYPLTSEARDELTLYRQALRDITSQEHFPGAVEWPTPPSWI